MRIYDDVKFENWARTFSCVPTVYVEVETEEEVLESIVIARSRNLKVRVVGSGHSPGDIVCTEGMLMSIDELNNVIEVDHTNKRVTVQAGIKIKDLNDHLATVGLALPNLGSISEQTLAGLISTGTHGTGLQHGILATMVESIRIVKSTLEVVDISRTKDEQTLLHAICSLGCFGVITRVTLNVVDAFNLHFTQAAIPFNYMIKNWDSLVKSAEFTRFWWFPHTNDCVYWKATKTTESPAPAPQSPIKTQVLGVWAYEFSLFVSSFLPSLVPSINQRHFDRFFRKNINGSDQSVKVFNFDCLFKQYVTEWAIDWKDGPEALVRLRDFIEKSGIKVHAPIEIRFVARDNIPLSPAYERDSCFIGIIMYRYVYNMHMDKIAHFTEGLMVLIFPMIFSGTGMSLSCAHCAAGRTGPKLIL
ncbi:hypothetical protein HDU67_004228 [Dinochytrium kinnereticum]|nr:hypothetical protein HDU67_004228 [Dinochytrium kinnereticum]